MNSIKIKSKSHNETQNLGTKIAKNLIGNEIILLYGEIGAGKTTFTQGLLKGLGYEGWGRSPTFVIINEYNLKYKVNHMDFYRLNDISELINLGIEEYLDSTSIKIIEWPEICHPILNKNHIKIKISQIANTERQLVIEFDDLSYSYLTNTL
tara:strand:+ start:102 stop:557 length:456 start_codon:yes stop_codon:yes gene_type:complete